VASGHMASGVGHKQTSTSAWRQRLALLLCAVSLAFGYSTLVEAQPVDGLASTVPAFQPPTIDRDRVDRQDPTVPRPAQPLQLPDGGVAVADASAAAGVRLTRVRFEGATLAPELLAATAAPFAGAEINQATLQQLADAVTRAYAKSDIAFYGVSIPSQPAVGGVITVRVIEGHFAGYRLNKTTRSTPVRLIDAQLKPLMEDRPARKGTIERSLSLLRDTPGQTVKAQVMKTTTPDELILDLDVERKQVDVTLNVNNRGVINVTSGIQAQLGVAINGLLREGDSTRFSGYIPTQPSRYQSYSASHATPIGAAGTTLGLSGAYVRTRTRNPEVEGEAKQAAIVLAHPLIRSYERNLSVSASLDATNSENYFLDTAFGGFRTRALRASANWSVVRSKGGYAISASLSQGLNALGARPTVGYSDTSYRKATVQAIGVKQVAKAFSLKASVRGQYTKDQLPITERFALGGEGAGIAYRVGVLTADKAIAGDVDLSWQLAGSEAVGRSLSVFVYADGALAKSYARPAYGLASSSQSLASAGGGVRVMPFKGWSATAQVAVPVKRPEPYFGKKARFLFSLTRTV